MRAHLAFLCRLVLITSLTGSTIGCGDNTAGPGGTGGTGGTGGSGGMRDAAIDAPSAEAAVDAPVDAPVPIDASGDAGTCAQTPTSCGMAGNCMDCTSSSAGHACVGGACGCNTTTNCPTGTACNTTTHLCSPACSGGRTCNGGCCDGTNCVAGTANGQCGSNGGACSACGGGTPNCNAGTCTSTCTVGGTSGVCGTGFCCNATNQCAAIGNTSCGTAGGACTDCTTSTAGPICLAGGTCGCNTRTDCPTGQACKNGTCGTACDMNNPCNGGCCDPTTLRCVMGNTSTDCALGGVMCGTCAGNANGSGCLSGANGNFCGCNSAAECPAGDACNPTTHLCTASCSSTIACNGGCCSAPVGGSCVGGTANGACGSNGGLCVSCPSRFASGSSGAICEPTTGGGFCGCDTNNDCPNNSTGCSTTAKFCNFACTATIPCLAGCCSGGGCQPGTANGACGGSGLCVNCATSSAGHVCLPSQTCGCNTAADCPAGTACDPTARMCTTACSAAAPCNGGCCSATTGGTCVAGMSASACGLQGGTCVDCTGSSAGHVCLANGSCGCDVAGDCPMGTACNTSTHGCENVCGNAQHTACNGGCCQNMACVPGTSNGACGSSGGACVACTNGTPTCSSGACTSTCGGAGNGTCAGGFCCSAGQCVAGTMAPACGYSGTCANCTVSFNGHKCETFNASGPWFCGCDVASDCPAANQATDSPGEACDTAAHNCTNTCGVAGLTLCNGGCCRFVAGAGDCVVGTGNVACGNSGGFCTNCSIDNCQPGPACVAGSFCGCTSSSECSGSMCEPRRLTECSSTNICCEPTGQPCTAATATLCCSGVCNATSNLCN